MINHTDLMRNIAIIAHVDHGKTTLVDKLLQQSGTFKDHIAMQERVMDSNEIEKERGITILAKNTAINWSDYHINIVDTPGHADFGGEVERILSMVDSVLLLVDACDGPMPQTRFVTKKAFQKGLNPIVVINKIDRPGARPDWVINQIFDLFDNLGATEEQLDFPIIYASALQGYATLDENVKKDNLLDLFQTIVNKVPPPKVDLDGPLQMQISQLDYSNYLGLIGVGRIQRGSIKSGQIVAVSDREGVIRTAKISQVLGYLGLDRYPVEQARAGDIVAIAGIEEIFISDTICDPNSVEPMPLLEIDEPTVSVVFQVNSSPYAGREGKFVTSRQIWERLKKEAMYNVALRIEETNDTDKFNVCGRGELQLGILMENMRREGYEFAISRPQVIMKKNDLGEDLEPFESLTVDVPNEFHGAVIDALNKRKALMKDMIIDDKGRARLDFTIPSRGLIGFQSDFMMMTSGQGLIYHSFSHYGKVVSGLIGSRPNGVLISNDQGKAIGYALFNLQERGRMFVSPGEEVYEGMIVGIHSRDNDLVVNILKAKQLTNIRASGSDENILLEPPLSLTLERAIEFINDDELVEVTPKNIRLRKKLLKEHERKKASRK